MAVEKFKFYDSRMDRPSDGRTTKAVGARLAITRQAIGLNQADFADNAGVKRNTYNQWETGVSRPQLDAAISLCDTYHLTLDWVYFGDPSGLRYDLAAAIKALREVRQPSP